MQHVLPEFDGLETWDVASLPRGGRKTPSPLESSPFSQISPVSHVITRTSATSTSHEQPRRSLTCHGDVVRLRSQSERRRLARYLTTISPAAVLPRELVEPDLAVLLIAVGIDQVHAVDVERHRRRRMARHVSETINMCSKAIGS